MPVAVLVGAVYTSLLVSQTLAVGNTCSTGLTITGSPNAALNQDFYGEDFALCGATGYAVETVGTATLRLGSSFISPTCNYTVNQSCYWAVYDYPDQRNLTARVHARCLSCPRPGQGCWAQSAGGPAIAQHWEVLTTVGAWEPAPAMRADCCKFKPTKCDNCTDDYCAKAYPTFGSCLKATLDTCCQAGGWINGGRCLCKEPVQHCEHSRALQESDV